MSDFSRVIFYYYISGFSSDFHNWILLCLESRKKSGAINFDLAGRDNITKFAWDLLDKKLDNDTIIYMLSGDSYFDKNLRDIAKLEREVKRSVFTLWDTDPIFSKYPNLRGFARNAEFEKMWNKQKQK